MKILNFATVLIIYALYAGFNPTYAQTIWEREHSAARNTVWTDRLERNIAYLADPLCEGRATGTRGNIEAAIWVQNEFKRAGLIPFDGLYTHHAWVGRGLVGHNILGMIPGSRKNPPKKYIIVGAHYDHLGTLKGKMYPGADANASGTVAMTSLAKMFSTMKLMGRTYGKSIIFIGFDAREMSFAGAQYIWESIERGDLKDPVSGHIIQKEDISLMVNIDQIGSTLSPLTKGREDFIIMLGNHSLHPVDRQLIEFCNKAYNINMEIGLTYYGSKNFTETFYRLGDQRIFIDNKVPTVLFTSGITMNTNRTYDTVESLNMEILQKRIYLMFHWIENIIR